MPKPNPGESKEAFVRRYMASEEARRDFPDEKQRAAVAYSTFGEKQAENRNDAPLCRECGRATVLEPTGATGTCPVDGTVEDAKIANVEDFCLGCMHPSSILHDDLGCSSPGCACVLNAKGEVGAAREAKNAEEDWKPGDKVITRSGDHGVVEKIDEHGRVIVRFGSSGRTEAHPMDLMREKSEKKNSGEHDPQECEDPQCKVCASIDPHTTEGGIGPKENADGPKPARCPCGGAWKHYSGALGYESLKCESCGKDIEDLSPEQRNAEGSMENADSNPWRQAFKAESDRKLMLMRKFHALGRDADPAALQEVQQEMRRSDEVLDQLAKKMRDAEMQNAGEDFKRLVAEGWRRGKSLADMERELGVTIKHAGALADLHKDISSGNYDVVKNADARGAFEAHTKECQQCMNEYAKPSPQPDGLCGTGRDMALSGLSIGVVNENPEAARADAEQIDRLVEGIKHEAAEIERTNSADVAPSFSLGADLIAAGDALFGGPPR